MLNNHHVVSSASSVRLVLSSGRTVTAEVVGSDADDDIAVLRADAGALGPLGSRSAPTCGSVGQ